ncbi:MAG: chromosome segregation SMC family protein, partial [Solirubrobacterales bacterium]
MYLKSLSLKGFKSFPDRTNLTFAPGVSVIVGPNGCGKSNITDSVLWALGEQSPTVVRGNTMQDVIFAGGKGSNPRRFAEVEVVIDNSEGRANSTFSEISIKRRVDRSGESEYRLNDARCRLADILETLADTNMGREMHSVISQGRVEQIVSSKPRDRRLMVEESAGLGKHRKRRRRAEIKLDRTRDNLDRAIDVEREARSLLRPLKRQAEAAERGAKLRAEEDELRSEIVASELRQAEDRLAAAEQTVGEGRTVREQVDVRLAEVAKRRAAIEERIAAGDRDRRLRGERLLEARTAFERVGARRDATAAAILQLRAALGERQLRLEELGAEEDAGSAERISELEAQLAELDESLGGAQAAREAVAKRDAARAEAEKAQRLRGELEGELAAVEARLAAALGEEGDDLLAGLVQAAPGLEQALSVALGERLRAALVGSISEGTERLGRAEGAARALLTGAGAPAAPGEPPTEDARPLLSMVEAEDRARPVIERLLGDAWLVEDLTELPEDFAGIAVTVDGDCYDAAGAELRRLPRAGTDPALLARSRREELALRLEQRTQTEQRAQRELEIASQELSKAKAAEDAAADSPQAVRRAQLEAELGAERRHAEAAQQASEARARDRERLAKRVEIEQRLLPQLAGLSEALDGLGTRLRERVEALQAASAPAEGGEEGIAAELRECSQEEFGLQTELRTAGEGLTVAEVEAAQLRDRRQEAAGQLEEIATRLERELFAAERPLSEEEREEIDAKLARVAGRREQVGPVNPLAEREYGEAREHLTDLKDQRVDLEKGLRELRSLIRRTDEEISAAFEKTFEATARNFEEMVAELFPGGSGKLRRVEEKPKAVPKPAENGAGAETG